MVMMGSITIRMSTLKKLDRWCYCQGRGVCLGCMIETLVHLNYGDAGVAHLKRGGVVQVVLEDEDEEEDK